MLQLIYELRKTWRGQVDGTEIERSIRGPRGPKNMLFAESKKIGFGLSIAHIKHFR